MSVSKISQTNQQILDKLDVVTIEDVDVILRSMTQDHYACIKNKSLIDWWLAVRYDLEDNKN